MKELEIVSDDYDCWIADTSHRSESSLPWYIVEHKQRRRSEKVCDIKIEQALDSDSNNIVEPHAEALTDVKDANRRKYLRQSDGKRHNTREHRRYLARERVKRRNNRLSRKKTIKPHGLNEDRLKSKSDSNVILSMCIDCERNDCICDTPTTKKNVTPKQQTTCNLETISEEVDKSTTEDNNQLPLQSERNELAKLAIATAPLSKDNSNEELTGLLESIQDITDIEAPSDEMDTWISHLENIVIMSYQISQAQSFTDVFVAVIAYIKMNTSKSVLKSIFKLIDEVTTRCPKEDTVPHAWNGQQVIQNWELFKTNTIFTKISYLLSAAMSLSVCSIKEIEWNPFGLQLVAVKAAEKQLKAVDVIDAVISTFTWFAETGYKVIEQRSLLPLLYSDQSMRDFNEECDWVLANAEQAVAGNLGPINDFEKRLDDVLRQVCEKKQVKCDGPTALWLQKRYSELVSIKHKVVAKHRNTALRFAPFGVGITGPSGVGKSTLSKLVMKIALHAMGFSTDPRRIITKDMFDQYDSAYTSDILGMFMDDVGNGKAEFAKVAFTDIVIKFFNNMAAQAVKAELNAKGIVFIAFKVGVITSNFNDYNVRQYSCKPEATLRRFVHTRTRIKEKYRKKGSISLDPLHPELEKSDLTQDVWELDLEECFIYETKSGKEAYKFRIMDVTLLDGREIHCKNLDLPTYIDAIIALAKQHKRSQDSVLKRSNDFDAMEMCAECSRPIPMCKCCVKPAGFEAIGDVIVDAAKTAVTSYVNKWLSPVNFLNSMLGYKPIKSMATTQLASEMKHVINETATPWLVAITPDWLFQTKVFKKSVSLWQQSAAAYDLRRQLQFGLVIGTGLLGLGIYRRDKKLIGGSLGGSWLGAMAYWASYCARVKHYEREYISRRNALPEFAKVARDSHVVKGAFVVSTLVVGLKLFKMWNKARLAKMAVPSGTLEVDSQPSWFGFMLKQMGMNVETSPNMKRATCSQMEVAFKRNNLFWADFTRADGSTTRCNIFFPRKCVAWFPYHLFFKNSDMTGSPTSLLTVKVRRDDNPGGVFSFKCDASSYVMSPNHDMVCAYVPNCPDLKDRINMLPLSKPTGCGTCQFLVRRFAEQLQERVTVEFGNKGHKYKDFYGGDYTTNLSKDGACMGILLSESHTPFIAGFHIGGNEKSRYGVMQTVTQNEANELINRLRSLPGILLSANTGEIPSTQYGRQLITTPEVHPHCMAHRLGADAYIEVLGSTRLRTKQKSSVTQSIISESVKRFCGVSNVWGPPPLEPNWKWYNATLEHIVNPADMFAPSLVERVRQDWLRPLKILMLLHREKEDFRPLTLREMVNGIDGKRFIDALPMITSMGFPLFGKKIKYFDLIQEGNRVIRVPSAIILAEMDRLMKCWKQGLRGYPVTTATLKDEPTPASANKVRVFQAGAVAMSLYIRKYFLPIARFLSLHPLVSESAVGVNAFSKQWEELMGHANKYAPDNKVIAWDYSKYDVRMNSQITRAVFASFIDLARIGGYPEEDLTIMEAMISDIVHPLIDYNGTMIMSYNMNTSGNNVTVNVNSTAGSFYVRLGFFHVYPNETNFRDRVAAMTYGDDFKGSVHPDYREFNFLSYKKFLGDHGMKLTLPNKSDDEVALMDEEDADFLKRQSNFIPEINCSIGKLDEKSIFKSLHSNLKSKTASPIEVSISCIETAMHEWFAHGREVYELRRSQIQQVCDEHQLAVPAVKATFDERVEHWLNKYSA